MTANLGSLPCRTIRSSGWSSVQRSRWSRQRCSATNDSGRCRRCPRIGRGVRGGAAHRTCSPGRGAGAPRGRLLAVRRLGGRLPCRGDHPSAWRPRHRDLGHRPREAGGVARGRRLDAHARAGRGRQHPLPARRRPAGGRLPRARTMERSTRPCERVAPRGPTGRSATTSPSSAAYGPASSPFRRCGRRNRPRARTRTRPRRTAPISRRSPTSASAETRPRRRDR